MSGTGRKLRFWNYPIPKQGPEVPYHNDAAANPVLRGYALVVVLWILSASSFVSSILWKNAKFDKLKDIKGLDAYDPRHDPTVIPTQHRSGTEAQPAIELPAPRSRANTKQHYTSADYVALYKSGELTPSDVAETIISLISRDLNGDHAVAFLECNVKLIREAARASTKRYQNEKPFGPLDGVPVAVKDEVDLTGYKRTLGSNLDFTNPTDQTAWCVKQWQEAGAIVVGKTNMHEIGLDTTNNNPIAGTPLNPHSPSHYCGGSSGGSGYAIAAGIVPIALGADGGGSIRIPSSMCGIYGLKPSHGRISGRPTKDLCYSVGVFGPMAASTDDLRLAYRIMAKPDPECTASRMFPDPSTPGSIPAPLSSISNGSETKQQQQQQKFLGLCTPLLARASDRVRAVFDRTIDHYTRNQGYTAVDISLPLLPQAQKAHALTILSEIGLAFSSAPSSDHNRPEISKLSYPSQLLLLCAARHTTAADFLAAQRLRNLLMQHLSYLWQKYPGMIIVTPTLPDEGLPVKNANDITSGGLGVWDGDAGLRSMEFVFLANFTGCPSLSRPMAFVSQRRNGSAEQSDGQGVTEAVAAVPLGVMGMAEWGCEEQLIDWAEEGLVVAEDEHEGQEEEMAHGGCRHPPASFELPLPHGSAKCQSSSGWANILGQIPSGAIPGDVTENEQGP